MRYPVLLRPSDDWIVATFPDLPGTSISIDARAEYSGPLATQLRGVLADWLTTCLRRGDVPPVPSRVQSLDPTCTLVNVPVGLELGARVLARQARAAHRASVSQIALKAGAPTAEQIRHLEDPDQPVDLRVLERTLRILGGEASVEQDTPSWWPDGDDLGPMARFGPVHHYPGDPLPTGGETGEEGSAEVYQRRMMRSPNWPPRRRPRREQRDA